MRILSSPHILFSPIEYKLIGWATSPGVGQQGDAPADPANTYNSVKYVYAASVLSLQVQAPLV